MSVPLFRPEVLDPSAALMTHYLESDSRQLDPELIGDLIREMRAVSGGAGELALCAFADVALAAIAHHTGGTKEAIWRQILGSLRGAVAERYGQ